MRSIHKKQTNNSISIGEWVKNGEKTQGLDFTNKILCEEMAESIKNVNDCPIFITGNRSLSGIEYISNYFGFVGKFKIIYLDANFNLLKENYESREMKSLTDEEFQQLLNKEVDSGINEIRDYTIKNLESCIYHYKTENDEKIYDSLKNDLSSIAYTLKKRGPKK